jgi:hypothetical protein
VTEKFLTGKEGRKESGSKGFPLRACWSWTGLDLTSDPKQLFSYLIQIQSDQDRIGSGAA